jgi:hypothetical protein
MIKIPQEKIERLAAETRYERRVVALLDILGWREKVADAGADEAKVVSLHRIVRILAEVKKAIETVDETDMRQTTFSDHVVISAPISDVVGAQLFRIAVKQMSVAGFGFLLRGAVTIGDIIHDDQIVFGPALIRAYDLERTVAVYPRIVLDQVVLDELKQPSPIIVCEDGISFLDPFTVDFFRRVQIVQAGLEKLYPETADGITLGINPYTYMRRFLAIYKEQLLSANSLKDWNKIAWLYDRISTRLGTGLRSDMFPKKWEAIKG